MLFRQLVLAIGVCAVVAVLGLLPAGTSTAGHQAGLVGYWPFDDGADPTAELSGHAGDGDVYLRIPIYVGTSQEEACADAEESTMRSYRRMAQTYASSAAGPGTTADEERAERGSRLANVTYEDLLRDRLALLREVATDKAEGVKA